MHRSVTNKIIMIILLLLGFSNSQSLYNGVGHIPADKQADWTNAGLQFSLPVYADKIITINNISGPDDSEVSAALNEARDFNAQNATNGHESYVIIYFPEGEYDIKVPISLNQNDHNRIIFQGDGPGSVLNFEVGNGNYCFYLHGTTGSEIDAPLNTTLNFHDNELFLNDISDFEPGDWIHFYENNFPYVESNYGYGAVGQITRLESVSGSYGIMKDEASKSYSTGYDLRIEKIYPIKNLGIEKVEIRTRSSEDVKKYIQKLKFEAIKLEFPEELEELKEELKKIYKKKIEELQNRKLLVEKD